MIGITLAAFFAALFIEILMRLYSVAISPTKTDSIHAKRKLISDLCVELSLHLANLAVLVWVIEDKPTLLFLIWLPYASFCVWEFFRFFVGSSNDQDPDVKTIGKKTCDPIKYRNLTYLPTEPDE
jgi:hypothetical protein